MTSRNIVPSAFKQEKTMMMRPKRLLCGSYRQIDLMFWISCHFRRRDNDIHYSDTTVFIQLNLINYLCLKLNIIGFEGLTLFFNVWLQSTTFCVPSKMNEYSKHVISQFKNAHMVSKIVKYWSFMSVWSIFKINEYVLYTGSHFYTIRKAWWGCVMRDPTEDVYLTVGVNQLCFIMQTYSTHVTHHYSLNN